MREFKYIEKPEKKLKTPYKLKQRGKVGNAWERTRREWFALNEPDYRGTYTCGLCGQPVGKNECDLDHILGRGSHPELRYELSNIRPLHRSCHIKRA